MSLFATHTNIIISHTLPTFERHGDAEFVLSYFQMVLAKYTEFVEKTLTTESCILYVSLNLNIHNGIFG